MFSNKNSILRVLCQDAINLLDNQNKPIGFDPVTNPSLTPTAVNVLHRAVVTLCAQPGTRADIRLARLLVTLHGHCCTSASSQLYTKSRETVERAEAFFGSLHNRLELPDSNPDLTQVVLLATEAAEPTQAHVDLLRRVAALLPELPTAPHDAIQALADLVPVPPPTEPTAYVIERFSSFDNKWTQCQFRYNTTPDCKGVLWTEFLHIKKTYPDKKHRFTAVYS